MSKYVYEVYSIGNDYKLDESTTRFIEKDYHSGNGYNYILDKENGVFVKNNYGDVTSNIDKYFKFGKTTPEKTDSLMLIVSAKQNGVPGGSPVTRTYDISYKDVKIIEEKIKSTLIKTIIAEEGTYPDNGISGDYWYIKIKKAIPTIKIGGRTVGAIKYKDSTGKIRNISSIRYKDSTGRIRNLK